MMDLHEDGLNSRMSVDATQNTVKDPREASEGKLVFEPYLGRRT